MPAAGAERVRERASVFAVLATADSDDASSLSIN
jgi:hypothetical protein